MDARPGARRPSRLLLTPAIDPPRGTLRGGLSGCLPGTCEVSGTGKGPRFGEPDPVAGGACTPVLTRARSPVPLPWAGHLRYVLVPPQTALAPEPRGQVGRYRPAAAVIPAPIAYIKVVAVKKLVVETRAWPSGPPHRVHWLGRVFPSGEPHALHWVCRGSRTFTLKKLECSKQAYARIH